MASLMANSSNTSISAANSTNQSAEQETLLGLSEYILHGPAGRITFIMGCIIVASLCIFGNLVVLFVLGRNQRMHTRTNLFLSNLAVADMFVGLFCVFPFMCRYLYVIWFLGETICKLWKFIQTASITVSMLFLQVIALERYVAINYPLKARRLFTQNRMYIVVLLVWLSGAAYSAPLLLAYETLTFPINGDDLTFCHLAIDKKHMMDVYRLMNFGIWYVLSLLIIVVVYTNIGLTVTRSRLNHPTIHLRHRSSVQMGRVRVAACSRSSDATTKEEDGETLIALAPEEHSAHDLQPSQSIKYRMKLWWKKKKMVISTKSKPPSRIVKNGSHGAQVNSRSNRFSPKGGDLDDLEARPSSSNTQSYRSGRLPQKISFKRESRHMSGRFGYADRARKSRLELGHYKSSTDSMSGESMEDARVHWTRIPAKRSTITIIKGPGDTGESRSAGELPGDAENSGAYSDTALPLSSEPAQVRRCRFNTRYNPRRRISRLIISIVIAFAVLLLPFHLHSLFELIHYRYTSAHEPLFFAIFSYLSLYMNSAVNPLLYSFVSQSFRRSFRESVGCCRPTERIEPQRAGARTPENCSVTTIKNSSY
ncbi:neuropeptide receptor a31 [Plakobranchus ocellatus]|uniref:Neuropeptide receptor a31 n=1 Tax=Plakobranchus ocellatus TaxID=259542 RepID=A0AAV4AFN4_9GAST|nr:neuropeptide receptor a31 [Plakobranchus ocellatus]